MTPSTACSATSARIWPRRHRPWTGSRSCSPTGRVSCAAPESRGSDEGGAGTDADHADVLVPRPATARLGGVKRPAVTNWERRHADFPTPVDSGAEVERFRADEVLAWLSGRAVPANA